MTNPESESMPLKHPEAGRAKQSLSRPCPICGEQSSTPIRNINLIIPENMALPRVFSINACNACGMIFHDVPRQDERESYYTSYTGEGIVDYPVSADQHAFNDATMAFLQQSVLNDSAQKILDIGCSFGITLLALKEQGYDKLYAIDPDRSAIAYLQRLGVAGRTGSATDTFADLEGCFDLIILRHVLEHLHDPAIAIANVATWLKPGGRIYIELPDLRRYPECAPFPGYFFEFEHINHFSLLSLLNLMRRFDLSRFESTPEIYPCLRALFEPSAFAKPIHRSDADIDFLVASITQPTAAGQHTLTKIADLKDREVALWGVSTLAYRLLTHSPLRNCNIRHLVDRDPKRQGETVFGITITRPETLLCFTGDIILCGENSADSIVQTIRDMGLQNRIVRLLQPPASNT
jgi:SAM-dependent methyltransferase